MMSHTNCNIYKTVCIAFDNLTIYVAAEKFRVNNEIKIRNITWKFNNIKKLQIG